MSNNTALRSVEPLLPVELGCGKVKFAQGMKAGRWVFATGLMAQDFANGIAPDEYDLVSVGGTAERFAAVRTGAAVGGMMLQPEDLRLMAEGFNRLALTTDYIPRYQWLTMVTHRDWVRQHEGQVVRAIRAMQDAIRWTYEPQNRDEAIAIMIEATKAPQEHAAATLDLYVNQLRIWPPDLDFEDAAMTSVIEVMGELNQLQPPLPAWSRYTDRTYLQQANAR